MGIDLSKGFRDLKVHVGHKISCVEYGDGDNVALECGTCNMILVDFSGTDTDAIKDEDCPTIAATVATDNGYFYVTFDAAPWFEQASDKDILALAACGWGGDYPADNVARFCEDQDAELPDLFSYASQHKSGFECFIEIADAAAWIQDNRPELYKQL